MDTTKFTKWDLINLNKILSVKDKLYKGKKIKDFVLQQSNGEEIKISDFRGKTTLIDFWASWCGPCRITHPKLKEIYNKHSDNLNIISLSFDEDKEDWLSAVKKDKLNWINVIDTKGWESEIANYYGVTSLPFNILIDEEGKIITTNIKPYELEEILKQ